jgi:hypothetical protein
MIETINTKIKNRYELNISVLVEKPENSKGMVFILHGFSSAKSRGMFQQSPSQPLITA